MHWFIPTPWPHSPLQTRGERHTGERHMAVDVTDVREQLRACASVLLQILPVGVLVGQVVFNQADMFSDSRHFASELRGKASVHALESSRGTVCLDTPVRTSARSDTACDTRIQNRSDLYMTLYMFYIHIHIFKFLYISTP